MSPVLNGRASRFAPQPAVGSRIGCSRLGPARRARSHTLVRHSRHPGGEGATVASTVTYLLPVVAIVLGVLVLGETITATVLAGIALVLAGVALTRRRTKTSYR